MADPRDARHLQSARYAMLSEVVLAIAQTTDLPGLLERVVRQVKWVLDFERCTLALADPDGQSYRLQTLLEARRTVAPLELERVPWGQDLPGAVMHNRQLRLLPDLRAERERYAPWADAALWDGSLASTLSLLLEAYGEEDRKIARTVATHLALAIDHLQQTERLKKANEGLAWLASFPRLNPGPIFEVALSGEILYLNPAAERIFPDSPLERGRHPFLADLPAIDAAPGESGQTSAVREVAVGECWYHQMFRRVPGHERLRFYVVDITERRRDRERLQRQNELLAALQRTALGLIRRLDLGELLQDIVSRASELLWTPHGFVKLLEPGGLEQKVGTGVFAATVGLRFAPGEGVPGQVLVQGQPLVVRDFGAWDHRNPSFDYSRIRSAAVVPLHSGEQVVGTLGIAYGSDTEREIAGEDVELLTRFAALASLALDNARLFAEVQQAKNAALAANEAKSASLARDPHPHERHHRHDRPAPRHRAHPRAARVRRDRAQLQRVAADDHQRHPRLLQDRGRPAGARAPALRPARVRGGGARAAVGQGRREGPRARLPHRPRDPRGHRGRGDPAAPPSACACRCAWRGARMKLLDELFREAGEAHHRAFAHASGDDPQWPRWYAEYLHPWLQAYVRRPLGREELAEWLARMGCEVQGPGWPSRARAVGYALLAPGKGVRVWLKNP